ncbi:MAG: hypothetical protein ABTD50_05505 [Polyangiaceae bacterium]
MAGDGLETTGQSIHSVGKPMGSSGAVPLGYGARLTLSVTLAMDAGAHWEQRRR